MCLNSPPSHHSRQHRDAAAWTQDMNEYYLLYQMSWWYYFFPFSFPSPFVSSSSHLYLSCPLLLTTLLAVTLTPLRLAAPPTLNASVLISLLLLLLLLLFSFLSSLARVTNAQHLQRNKTLHHAMQLGWGGELYFASHIALNNSSSSTQNCRCSPLVNSEMKEHTQVRVNLYHSDAHTQTHTETGTHK